MGDTTDMDHQDPLELEDVARAAAELAAEQELDRLLARFLERLREWASPSAVLAAVREPSAEGGWRLLPSLSFGSGPLGAERALSQMIDDTPGCLDRPVLVHPGEPAPGVQPRDNCILPWAHEGESGVLVIRGIPHPAPPNLGEALAVLSAPVWPRLLGSPASRVESLVVDLRRVAERLEADAERQIERLRAARPPATGDAASEAPVLVEQLEAVRRDAQQTVAERDEARERLLALETALKEAEADRDESREKVPTLESALGDTEKERDQARAEREELEGRNREAEEKVRVADEARAAARADLDAARSEGEHSTLEWDDLKGRVATLQEALEEVEGERDRVRDESERLSARLESIQSEHASALDQADEQRRTVDDAAGAAEQRIAALEKDLASARQEVERVAADGEELNGRLAVLEENLQRAESDRDEARAESERLGRDHRVASDASRDLDEALATSQRDLESAQQERQRATAEAGEMRARVGSLEATLQQIEAERDGARGHAESLEEHKRVAEATARTAEEALASVRQQLEELRVAGAAASDAAPSGERAEKALVALRSTMSVLRRTPFVPPGLRVSMEEGRAVLDSAGEPPESWLRVALLDRDAASLEPLADELEEAGVDVRLANYPEELALLMKTPDAQGLNVAVCDILAFRPDQTVAGLLRGWQKDRPGLAFFLSFNSDDTAEAERAKRVPISVTAGRLPRPIPGAELIEKLQVLKQKLGPSEE